MAENKRDLAAAKLYKKDEFYTQLTDIEKELRHYRKHFKGKVVFCNCDDPFESNFFKYFVLNFNRLEIKKLIATCYATSSIMGSQLRYYVGENGQMSFSFGDETVYEKPKRPYKAIVNTVHDTNGDGGVDMFDVAELFRTGENELTELEGDGDFRSKECLELLDKSDIIVTNPPFSLFRDYVSVLMEHKKHFIIIGNQNAITYKEFFPYLRDNKIWLGNGFAGNVGFFTSPYEDVAVSSQHKEGMIRVSGVMWFTNLDIKKRHEEMILVKRYVPDLYPKYENFDAIEVSKTADIPCDYAGIMGVPITFMDKYSPDQFKIIGLGITDLGKSIGVGDYDRKYKTPASRDGTLYYVKDGKGVVPYARVLIQNKHPEEVKK